MKYVAPEYQELIKMRLVDYNATFEDIANQAVNMEKLQLLVDQTVLNVFKDEMARLGIVIDSALEYKTITLLDRLHVFAGSID
jgi:hypothetical protein